MFCGFYAGWAAAACIPLASKPWPPGFLRPGGALAIAVLMSAPTVGVAVPNFVMPALEAALGWQGAFRAVGLGVMGLAGLIMVFLREAGAAAGPRRSFAVGLKYVLASRNLILIGLIGFCGLWVQIGFGSVGNDYLVSAFGLNLKAAGWVMAVYGLSGLAVSLAAGFLAGRRPRYKKSMTVVSAIC